MPTIPASSALDRRQPLPLADLRRRIRALERSGAPAGAVRAGAVAFGAPEIDRALPWGGLARGCLHEVAQTSAAAADDGAALGFLSALLARLLGEGGHAEAGGARGAVLWCLRVHVLYEVGDLYGPGLAALGLDPERLIAVRGRTDADVLWAMREGLGCRRLAAVVGEAHRVDLSAGRRLQLAAERSGVSAFLLRPDSASGHASAAVTRWRVRAAPSGPSAGGLQAGGLQAGIGAEAAARRGFGPGRPCWRVELVRCRGAAADEWVVEWRHETGDFKTGSFKTGSFAVVPPLSDRSAEPAATRLAR